MWIYKAVDLSRGEGDDIFNMMIDETVHLVCNIMVIYKSCHTHNYEINHFDPLSALLTPFEQF